MKPVRGSEIGEDEPVTLKEACRLFFSDRITPSALRTEAGRGNLDIMQIARKDFVTKRAIEEMKLRCTKRAIPRPLPDAADQQERQSGISAQEAVRLKLRNR